MNRKGIRSVLGKVFKDWAESITDEKVKDLVEKNTIITGGSIASMLLNEQPKDYDVYFRNKETTKAVARYYVEKFNNRQGTLTNKIGYKTKAFVHDGAIPITENEDAEAIGENWDWGSHMLKIDPDRIKIIVRSDGVAAEDGSIIQEPFEDV